MNKETKQLFKNFSKGTASFISNLNSTFVSILRMCVLSSLKVAKKSKKCEQLKTTKSCCILGNGPSLKDDLEHGRVRLDGNDVMGVNMFCWDPSFRVVKPRFYFLIDGAYFNPPERHKERVDNLITSLNEVDWDMYLMIPSATVSGSKLLRSVNNEHIKIIRINSTSVEGFRGFRHWIYRHRLGMPHCQTVVNFSVCEAINMHYDDIYLYGVDHTWTRDLYVDDNNVVCQGVRHVYDKNLSWVKRDYNFAAALGFYGKMFRAHYLLEEYSQSVGVKIWNCSSDTFLDAYERKTYSENKEVK